MSEERKNPYPPNPAPLWKRVKDLGEASLEAQAALTNLIEAVVEFSKDQPEAGRHLADFAIKQGKTARAALERASRL